MRRYLAAFLILAGCVPAAQADCIPVQTQFELCQDSGANRSETVVGLGDQGDGWTYLAGGVDTFTRVLESDAASLGTGDRQSAYLATLQGQVVQRTEAVAKAGGRLDFAVSVRQSGTRAGTPIHISLIPFGAGSILIIETFFPNKFQLPQREVLTAEQRGLHESIVTKIKGRK